jgi:hypothetical protein
MSFIKKHEDIKSRKMMRWMLHCNIHKRWEMHAEIWLEDLKERPFRKIGSDGRIILKWILRK